MSNDGENKEELKQFERKLRELHLPDALVSEMKEVARLGLPRPPTDLADRIMERCIPIIEQEQHRRRMETSFLYRTFNNICDYVKSWYK